MEALAIGSAPPRPGLAALARYSHLRRPGTVTGTLVTAARRPVTAASMDAAAGGRPSPAPIRCTSAETVSFSALDSPVSTALDLGSPRIPSCEVRVAVVQDAEVEVDEVATSSHAAGATTDTEQGGNGSPVAGAADSAEVVPGVDGIRIRRRPVTGPAVHYVGPFQFRLENEGNTPRNILEKIIWDKDVEVSQARLDGWTRMR